MRQVESFSLGGVFDATFRVLGKNLIPLILLGAVILVPTTFLSDWMLSKFGEFSLTVLGASMLLSLFSYTLLQAALICAVFHTLRGDEQSLADTMAQTSRALPFAILASLAYTLVLSIGLVLLIIPGIFLLLVFWLAVPVAAIERVYPLKAMARSAELTKGYRGKLFGLFVIYVVASLVVGAIVGGLSFAIDPKLVVGPTSTLTNPGNWVNWIAYLISSVTVAVTYYDLRLLKEDMDSEAVAGVFD